MIQTKTEYRKVKDELESGNFIPTVGRGRHLKWIKGFTPPSPLYPPRQSKNGSDYIDIRDKVSDIIIDVAGNRRTIEEVKIILKGNVTT